MRKKLLLRFMLIGYSLMLVLLLAVCGAVSVYLYESAVGDTEQAIRQAVEQQALTDETHGMAGIQLDEHGTVVRTEQKHLSLTEETVQALAEAVPADEVQSVGVTEADGIRFRYMTVPREGGRWIVAAECARETAVSGVLKRRLPLYLAGGAVLLVPAAMFLAMWVSRPIAAAWEKQNDFVADATHELKTPLAVIAADTEAVLSNPEAEISSQEHWLGSIQTETNHMAGLVANLLFLAKADAGEIRLDVEEFDISDMLEELCMSHEADIYEAGIRFDYELTPGLKYRGDRNRLLQMADELLHNAVQFTPAGSAVRVVVNRDRKLRVRMVVSNSGCPIPEAHLPKIFDRFYRVDASRTRATGGAGLGLCVAKSIAELHGGDITAECRNGINVFSAVLGVLPERASEKK